MPLVPLNLLSIERNPVSRSLTFYCILYAPESRNRLSFSLYAYHTFDVLIIYFRANSSFLYLSVTSERDRYLLEYRISIPWMHIESRLPLMRESSRRCSRRVKSRMENSIWDLCEREEEEEKKENRHRFVIGGGNNNNNNKGQQEQKSMNRRRLLTACRVSSRRVLTYPEWERRVPPLKKSFHCTVPNGLASRYSTKADYPPKAR